MQLQVDKWLSYPTTQSSFVDQASGSQKKLEALKLRGKNLTAEWA